MVKWTTRWKVYGNEHRLKLREAGQRFIHAFWHNKQVFFTFSHRDDRCCIMVSKSADGDIVAKVMELSRIEASRGSSSRGASAAVRDMMEVLGRGYDLGITPDGPKGPAHQVKPGVLFLARKLGIPIVPITNATSRCLVLKRTWDQYQVPLPFARAVIRYAPPIWVGPDDDLAEKAEELRVSLNRITEEAEREVDPARRWPWAARLVLWLEDILFPVVGLAFLARFALSARRRVLLGLGDELSERFGRVAAKPSGRPLLWIHAASAGEVAAVEGLAERLRGSHEIAVTCTTRAGRDQARKSKVFDHAFVAPLDAGPFVREFLSRTRPRALLLAETELWPAMIAQGFDSGLKLCLVNARLSDKSFAFYSKAGALARPFLSRFDAVLAQTEADADRFRRLGAPDRAVAACGNLKFDRVQAADASAASDFIARMGWEGSPLFVAGSTHPGEEEQVLAAFKALHKDFPALRLVLAPRHVERAAKFPGLARWTGGPERGKNGVVLDALGILPSFYPRAAFSFVGGTLAPVGGHNLMEPAIAGSPVLFGPHFHHQRQAAEALLKSGGILVSDASSLESAGRVFCADPLKAQELGRAAAEAARSLQGATARTLARLEEILKP